MGRVSDLIWRGMLFTRRNRLRHKVTATDVIWSLSIEKHGVAAMGRNALIFLCLTCILTKKKKKAFQSARLFVMNILFILLKFKKKKDKNARKNIFEKVES